METPEGQTFRLLTEDEFDSLTTQQRIEYLKEAMAVRNSINRQIDAELTAVLPSGRKRKP
jgi:hypothetical protein